MVSYELQFTVDDVVAVMQKWQKEFAANEERRYAFCDALCHHFNRYLNDTIDLNILIDKGKYIVSDQLRQEHYEQAYLKNIFQRAYVQNIVRLLKDISDKVDSLIYFKPDKSDEPQENKATLSISHNLHEISTEFYGSLEELVQYLPITPMLEQLAPLTEKQRKRCVYIDTMLSMLVYFANKMFSPEFQRIEYHFKEDVNAFCDNNAISILSGGTDFSCTDIERIVTSTDYFTHTVEPLIWNIFEHAFNPEHDTYGRLNSKFLKRFYINGYPEQMVDISPQGSHGYKIPADSGNYIVVVKDNGFGIPRDVLPHLFEKGFTTKPDKEGHGIGLWGVKEFIEQNNDTISVETKLDDGTTAEHGTSFKFTIPYYYDHAKSICVQKR